MHFLLFPQCFLLIWNKNSYVFIKFEIVVCNVSVWKSLKIVVWECVNFSPNNILDWTKLRALANDSLNLDKMIIFLLDRLENIVGKEKMLVPIIFSKAFFLWVVKRVNSLPDSKNGDFSNLRAPADDNLKVQIMKFICERG